MGRPAQGIAEAEALLVSTLPVVEEVVAFVCRRGRVQRDEAEEFGSIVRLKLVERDYQILRRFEGRSSLRTYLSVTIQRLYLDFQRQRWGVWRPSAEASRLGETAVRLDCLMHRDGIPLEQAIEMMRSDRRVGESPAELRALAERLPRRRPRPRADAGGEADSLGSAEDLVEGPALADERHRRAHSLRKALQVALGHLAPEDALALRMRFGEGFTVTHVACLLRIPSKRLYHRIERVLAGLRLTLLRGGFDAAEVFGLLGDPAFDDQSIPRVGIEPTHPAPVSRRREAPPPGSPRS